MGNMATAAIGKTVLVRHNEDDPEQEEWDAMLRQVEGLLDKYESVNFLVWSDGGGPDAKRRTELNTMRKGRAMRAAVLTESTVARGIVTALAWLKVMDIKSFSFDQMDQAAKFVDIIAPLEEVRSVFSELSAQIR